MRLHGALRSHRDGPHRRLALHAELPLAGEAAHRRRRQRDTRPHGQRPVGAAGDGPLRAPRHDGAHPRERGASRLSLQLPARRGRREPAGLPAVRDPVHTGMDLRDDVPLFHLAELPGLVASRLARGTRRPGRFVPRPEHPRRQRRYQEGVHRGLQSLQGDDPARGESPRAQQLQPRPGAAPVHRFRFVHRSERGADLRSLHQECQHDTANITKLIRRPRPRQRQTHRRNIHEVDHPEGLERGPSGARIRRSAIM
mmetsp:Transcript_23431/g.55488  ORF Transcript_23431/g.55488 Transcript_23431/m.55488 type:complete len:255 (+) Transcript_23431:1229-1993(+)